MVDHERIMNNKYDHWLVYKLMAFKFHFTNLEAQMKE